MKQCQLVGSDFQVTPEVLFYTSTRAMTLTTSHSNAICTQSNIKFCDLLDIQSHFRQIMSRPAPRRSKLPSWSCADLKNGEDLAFQMPETSDRTGSVGWCVRGLVGEKIRYEMRICCIVKECVKVLGGRWESLQKWLEVIEKVSPASS